MVTTMDTTPDYIITLHSYAKQISHLLMNSDPNTMIVVKRLFHIINLFLRKFQIDTKEKSKEFNRILKSISYAPPWDEEDVIFDHLHKFCDYLSIYYANSKELDDVITEDIKNIALIDEIEKILDLELSF